MGSRRRLAVQSMVAKMVKRKFWLSTILLLLAANVAKTQDLTITTPPLLPSFTVGVAYSQAIAVTGGTAPYTWSILAGALPGGLALNSASGTMYLTFWPWALIASTSACWPFFRRWT